MNRIVFTLTILLHALTTAAVAAPIAYYNPSSGNIRFGNDTGGTLAGMYLQSLSGDKVINDPNRFAQIPGTTFNSGDLPFGFTYFGFPPTSPVNTFPTSLDIGNVIVPGTPTSDLSVGAFNALMVEFIGTVVGVPEPATLPMVGLALVGTAAASRQPRSIRVPLRTR
ncbi:MAG: PEP-CTERM sorting domain-containing protein [Planctomycetaceae bacterium]|nr:PEP-CTERM sorting domain-containing protein [Planctomycetaceae bacterium]